MQYMVSHLKGCKNQSSHQIYTLCTFIQVQHIHYAYWYLKWFSRFKTLPFKTFPFKTLPFKTPPFKTSLHFKISDGNRIFSIKISLHFKITFNLRHNFTYVAETGVS